MILSGRSSDEIKHISNFAHHAGIVYQLQDDILDATADPTVLGKAIGQDEGKINIVRSYGIDEAKQLKEKHLASALNALQNLPFPTKLLSGIVMNFASRTF
jgi:geranylgeranyl pyrophosphate synthase